MDKQCLECGDKIVGRIDKKFCSDGCRNAYNNKVNKDSKNLIRNTNNRLRKNYRILETLNPNQKTNSLRIKIKEYFCIFVALEVSHGENIQNQVDAPEIPYAPQSFRPVQYKILPIGEAHFERHIRRYMRHQQKHLQPE